MDEKNSKKQQNENIINNKQISNFKKSLDNFTEMIINNWKYDPWIQIITLKRGIADLKSEVQEFETEKNIEEKTKELGDILWDVFNMIYLYSKKYNVELQKAFEMCISKMKRRKPYIFQQRPVNIEYAQETWFKAKDKEKKELKRKQNENLKIKDKR